MSPESGAKLLLRGSNESGLGNIWPDHLLQRTVRQTKPCGQIHLKGLASVGEDVERNFRSFLLKIRNELLQQCYPVNLEVSLKHWQEIIQEVLNTRNNTRFLPRRIWKKTGYTTC